MSPIRYIQFCLVCQVSTFWGLWFDVILHNLKFSGAPRKCINPFAKVETKSSPLVNLLHADAPGLCRIADSRKTEENQKPRNLPPFAEVPYSLVKSLWWPFHKCAN